MRRMMKRTCLMIVCGVVLVGCEEVKKEQPKRATAKVVNAAETRSTARPRNYVALPGRAATGSETVSALDSAAAAYEAQRRAEAEATIPEPRAVADTGLLSADGAEVSPASNAPYALQILNGTQGRLFIEAQDDSGNIFPFGFMYSGQRVGTQPQEPRLIVGKLTVIVRDPDSPGAPEIRRYRITPPSGYESHTLGITILPGGRYRVMVDGRVHYVSPEPDEQKEAGAE